MPNIFSFIIISYNRVKDTIDALKNVLNLNDVNHWRKEIIILNNNSTEDYSALEKHIKELPAEQQAQINYIHHSKNLGVAGGRNFCIQQAKGTYLFFLDDDAEIVQKNAIQIILDYYQKYAFKNLGIIGFIGKNQFDNSYQTPIKNQILMKDKNEVFYNLFYGFGHVFPKSLIDKTGYYQDDFFYGMEEYDLSFLAIKNGYSILFSKEIVVLHKVNPNGREQSIQTQIRYFENRMIVCYKHLPIFYVITQFLMWSMYFLVNTKLNFIAYFKSIRHLIKRIQPLKREPMNEKGMIYLRKVRARLWY